MKRQKLIFMLRGVGVGFILASILFFALKGTLNEATIKEMTDTEIIEKATELGMVPITKVEDVYLSDDDVIERAKELGMEFSK